MTKGPGRPRGVRSGKLTGFRLPEDLWDAVEAFRIQQEERTPGATVSTSEAIRILLYRGLAATKPEGRR